MSIWIKKMMSERLEVLDGILKCQQQGDCIDLPAAGISIGQIGCLSAEVPSWWLNYFFFWLFRFKIWA
jgi:hypothetical protein